MRQNFHRIDVFIGDNILNRLKTMLENNYVAMFIYLKTNTKLHKLMRVSLVMIMAGALGNIIDRIRLGFVVDFIDVRFGNLYDYPVFNIADSAIVIATIFIAYLVLFDKYQRD